MPFDIFGRQPQVLAGALSSDRLFMIWDDLPNHGLGLMIQEAGIGYTQPIDRIFELGPGALVETDENGLPGAIVADGTFDSQNGAYQVTYYTIGRSQGQVRFSKVVGPTTIAQDFYQQYGNACDPNILSLGGRIGCEVGGSSTPLTYWDLYGVTISTYQSSVNTRQSFIQENIDGIFANLNLRVSA